MKKGLLLIIICICLFTLTACKETKKYQIKDLTIEVQNIFTKRTIEGYELCLESEEIIITFSEDSKSEISNLGLKFDDLTIQQYVDIYTSNKSIDIINEDTIDNYKLIEFENIDDNETYWIRMYFYKTSSRIWIIQFLCNKESKGQYIPKYEKWVSTIEIKK